MRFRLLGPLAVDAAGRRLEISAARDRVLLAMLLLHPNRVVTLPRLIDAVWGDAAPVTARAQLHTCVSRLRRQLPGTIETDTAGYRAAVATDELDTLVFAQLVADGRTALAIGELRTAQKHLRAALELWRGPALAGVDSPGVEAAAVALEEQHAGVLEDCIDVELALGLQAQLVSELTGLVEQHPLRERLHGQLMTALARVGRTADALAVYRRLSTTLDEELGIAPSGPLQELHRKLLHPLDSPDGPGVPDGPTPRRIPVQRGDTGDVGTAPGPPWTLPRDIADYAGRDDVVAGLVALVGDAGLGRAGRDDVPLVVTVDGMAGVGKTSLAVHVAHLVADSYPDGRLFIDLHAHSTDRPPLPLHEAIGLLLRHLGLEPAGIPADLDERIARWRSELARRRILVVLDNAADTAQVTPLLPGASASLVLVTSRRRLGGLDGAHAVSLDVLTGDEAAQLVTTVVGSRALADPDATAHVVQLCGGLPLALRLAAARLAHRPSWSVADLADRLRHANPPPVELAVDGRSVQAAFALSYRQLPVPAQRLFRLLGLHPSGEFAVNVAAALTDRPLREADQLLELLVDAHLLNEPGTGRFRLHDLLRDYAAQLAAEDPERDDATLRMLDFYLQATAAATRLWEVSQRPRGGIDELPSGPHVPPFADTAATRHWLDAEVGNVIAVTHLADRLALHRHTCLLTRALWFYLFRNSLNDISIDLHQRALAAAEALGDDDLATMAHNYIASAYARSGRWADAAEHLALVVEHPDWGPPSRCNLAWVYVHIGRFAEAWQLLDEALRPQHGPWVLGLHWWAGITVLLRCLGRYREAILVARRCLAVGRTTDRRWPAATGGIELAAARQRLGQHRHAVLLLRWARRQLGADAGPAAELESRSYLGVSLVALGDVEEGLELLRTAFADADQLDPTAACLTGNNYGEALASTGRLDEAGIVHARVLERAIRTGSRYEQARAYRGLGLCTTDPGISHDRLRTALELFELMGTPERDEVAALIAARDPAAAQARK